jgi:4-alpha-glucanotransferase
MLLTAAPLSLHRYCLICPAGLRQLMAQFRAANSWIEDSALFDALRQQEDLAGKDWWEWPDPLRFRKASALKEAHKQHKQQVDEFVAVQFLFDRQWRAVKVRGAALDMDRVQQGVAFICWAWMVAG